MTRQTLGSSHRAPDQDIHAGRYSESNDQAPRYRNSMGAFTRVLARVIDMFQVSVRL
ncbi:unnamed protein product [Rhizoctonia solani]|uniref:Uncharacterized protein n=1 Tax=Rhizoctonia solani TaxID=456999 RepID=A0A8H3H5Y4_9AGAM|nr:unnamed protein product [Rhizoctonia solani]